MDKNTKILKNFILELNLLGYSENTIKTYRLTVEDMLKRVNKDPKDIDEIKIKEYLIYLKKDRNNSNKTMAMKTNAIKTFLKTLKNPAADDIRLPKVEKTLPTVLSIEEVKRLLECAGNTRDHLTLRVLYSTGVRVSELVKLRINDIQDQRIHIRSGKGSKDRIIYIDPKTEIMIKTYIEQNRPKTHIFENKENKPLTPRTIQRIVEKYRNKAGIDKEVTPHILRHSFATHLLQNKADIVVIKELLGHSSLTTTQIYTNISNEFRERSYNSAHPLAKEETEENKKF